MYPQLMNDLTAVRGAVWQRCCRPREHIEKLPIDTMMKVVGAADTPAKGLASGILVTARLPDHILQKPAHRVELRAEAITT